MKCELGAEEANTMAEARRVTPPYESLKRWSEGEAVRYSSVKRRDCDGITAFGTVSIERPRAVSDPVSASLSNNAKEEKGT